MADNEKTIQEEECDSVPHASEIQQISESVHPDQTPEEEREKRENEKGGNEENGEKEREEKEEKEEIEEIEEIEIERGNQEIEERKEKENRENELEIEGEKKESENEKEINEKEKNEEENEEEKNEEEKNEEEKNEEEKNEEEKNEDEKNGEEKNGDEKNGEEKNEEEKNEEEKNEDEKNEEEKNGEEKNEEEKNEEEKSEEEKNEEEKNEEEKNGEEKNGEEKNEEEKNEEKNEEEKNEEENEKEELDVDFSVIEEMANAQALATPQHLDLEKEKKTMIPFNEETRNPNYRKYENEDPSDSNWSKHKKHIFVLSNAGSPIYSRYGDESKLAGLMGILSAIISVVESEDDLIQEIVAGDHKFIFCQKGPLYFVSVSRTLEPSEDLLLQLEYVHSQIFFLLTGGVNRIFESRPSFDLRNLLSGTVKTFDNLISFMDHDATAFTNTTRCLPLDPKTRETVGQILLECRTSSVLFGMIVAKHQLVQMIRPKKRTFFPSDMHLILNFINSVTSLKSNETWTPICLPRFTESGFLHSYIRYLADDIGLILFSTKAESFYELSDCAKHISTNLEVSGSLKEIIQATQKKNRYSVLETGNSDLLHFIYISKDTSQLTQPVFSPPYTMRKNRKRLFRIYQFVKNRSSSGSQISYYRSNFESVYFWETSHFILFCTFDSMERKERIMKASNQLLQWIETEKDRLFILSLPVFKD